VKKSFSRVLSGALATVMLLSTAVFAPVTTVQAADFSTVGGWYETLYAQWSDSDPDSSAVRVGYKLSSDSSYTYLSGDDLTYLVRTWSSGVGRVDIPGLAAGTYDLEVTASNGTVYTKTGIEVYAHDRSGYAHFNYTEGVGAYKDDGTPKDNALIIYVTDSNKNSVTIPGYGNQTINYTNTAGTSWTRDTAGIGDILNNNYNFIKQVTVDDDHPLIIRFIGTVNPPENLTPYGAKDTALGGSTSDNGFLAITKDARNITLEGIGPDAVIDGWGFTFSKSSTATMERDKNFEVRNLTFQNYPEDGLAFQGHDSNPNIQRIWVHNNNFYPGYCKNPTESDKSEGDGSCDFKRGYYYTNSYNYYQDCHKTNLIGGGTSDDQNYITFHHNWYKNVESRQPLAANGVMHIYNSYFQNAGSVTVDCRGSNSAFLEANYYDSCKNYYKSRNTTCIAKSYNEYFNGGSIGDVKGTRTVVTSRTQSAIEDNGYAFPNGDSNENWDMNSTHFYYANGKSDVEVLNDVSDVPSYVQEHAGTLKAITSGGSGTPGGETGGEETTETTTSSQSGGEEGSTETTTSAPVITGGYEHNFTADGKTSSFYTITGNLSTSKGTVSYNGLTLTQCLKMESSTNITFNAPAAGTLVLVFGGTTDPVDEVVKIDGDEYTVRSDGTVQANLSAGSHTVTKGSTINLFYMTYAVEGSATESTTEATTASTTETTTTTTTTTTTSTTTTTTEATTESTTDAATEATTQAPITGAGVAVSAVTGTVGSTVEIPVTVSGMSDFAAGDITLTYDTSKLNVSSVSLGSALAADASLDYSASNGTIKLALVNPRDTLNGSEIAVINATLTTEGQSWLGVSVNYLYGANLAQVTSPYATGAVITANAQASETLMGDANGDGAVTNDDVIHILQYVTGRISNVVDAVAAEVTGDNKVTARDANKIKKFLIGKITSLS